MKNAERITMVAILIALVGGGVWGYYAVVGERKEFRERVAAGEFEIRDEVDEVPDAEKEAEREWRRYYPVTHAMRIGDTKVEASVADTLSQRIKGLSDTPYLPEGVVKLFAFGVPGEHTIWMKDMNYALDIIWAAEDGSIVHIEENVSPNTYVSSSPQDSKRFSSPVPAWFVVETNAGFVEANDVAIGDVVMIPRGE